MSTTILSQTTTSVSVRWDRIGIIGKVAAIRDMHDGAMKAEISFVDLRHGQPKDIALEALNMLTASARSRYVKLLAEKSDIGADVWQTILDELCNFAIRKHRQGADVIEMWTMEDVPDPQYLVYPVNPLQQPSIIFGLGGTGKSYLALYLALCAQLPWPDNPLDFGVRAESNRCLYLDYETDEHEILYRWKALVKGHDLPDLPILYRRGLRPLREDADEIAAICGKHNCKVLVVDSLAAAAGGDLLHESALGFFRALRELPVTPIIIAHTSKNQGEEGDDSKTIFGSAFFTNYARSVWELRSKSQPESKELIIKLANRKTNRGMHRDISYKLIFSKGQTRVEVA